MSTIKKPAPGQDLSQTSLAASLERDKDRSLMGELDLGLDGDPDLRTRPGQASLLRPKRKSRVMPVIAILAVVAAVVAWALGVLDPLGVPPPPQIVTDALRNLRGRS